jgi:hypothetical protein
LISFEYFELLLHKLYLDHDHRYHTLYLPLHLRNLHVGKFFLRIFIDQGEDLCVKCGSAVILRLFAVSEPEPEPEPNAVRFGSAVPVLHA